ncbi:MAG: flagellar basal body P-ring protein FlgI [Planctomycetia bacterium]|jgi:flagellar P-ring protein precursor FlgI
MKNILKLSLVLSVLMASSAMAQVQIGSICRIKGQEKRVLIGRGIVYGLAGTGDGNQAETQRAMASIFGKFSNAQLDMRMFKNAKNVAIVLVKAEIPACGARQGDQVTCTVASVGGAKSLKGGMLFTTAMLPEGPGIDPTRPMPVCGYASGLIKIDSKGPETVGHVAGGCRLEQDFFNPFVKDGKITLVLDRDHAYFGTSYGVAEAIKGASIAKEVKAVDQNNIVVTIPQRTYGDDPTKFVASILRIPIPAPEAPACVVINRRTGVIVLTGDVEIGPVAISSGNFDVAVATGQPEVEQFLGVDQASAEPNAKPNAKLRALLSALKQIKASPETQADIIIQINRAKKLYAQLIVE